MASVLEIRPLARVEGHGAVRVVRDGGRTVELTLSLCESPRLFEALLVGKAFREVPEIICRICSICSTVHRVTALLAIENAFGVEVSEQTRLFRELAVYGGLIESHALHLFCLALPDFLGVRGFADLATAAPELLKKGLAIKGAGNLVQETVGGRLIHPVNLIPGGMGKPVDREGLQKLRDALAGVIPACREAISIVAGFTPSPSHPARRRYLAVTGDGAPYLFGHRLATGEGSAFAAASYREHFSEAVTGRSNAKEVAVDGEQVTVGALARLNVRPGLPPAAADAMAPLLDRLTGADIRANSLAQAVELLAGGERAVALIDELLGRGVEREPPASITPRRGCGTAATEAPRGVLIHSYTFDGRGICTGADVITPTAINQASLERDLTDLARELDGRPEEELRHELEVLVRAYDPCISCAVHIIQIDRENGRS